MEEKPGCTLCMPWVLYVTVFQAGQICIGVSQLEMDKNNTWV